MFVYDFEVGGGFFDVLVLDILVLFEGWWLYVVEILDCRFLGFELSSIVFEEFCVLFGI